MTISTAVKDLSGNALAQNKIWSFTTIPSETVLPVITSTTPPDGVGNVSAFTTVSAVFSEALDPTTINSASFAISGVTGTVAYDGATRTATLTPSVPLANLTTYTVTVTTAVKDLAGNAMPLDRVWTSPPWLSLIRRRTSLAESAWRSASS